MKSLKAPYSQSDTFFQKNRKDIVKEKLDLTKMSPRHSLLDYYKMLVNEMLDGISH